MSSPYFYSLGTQVAKEYISGGWLMEENINLIKELHIQIEQLEEKMAALRVSRRVLMNLLDYTEKDKWEQLVLLQNQNSKLRKDNCQYARIIMHQNSRIAKLEEKIKNNAIIT